MDHTFSYKLAGKATEVKTKVFSYSLVFKEGQSMFDTLPQPLMIYRENIPAQITKSSQPDPKKRAATPRAGTGAKKAASQAALAVPVMFRHLST